MRILATLLVLVPIAYQAQATTLSVATSTLNPQTCSQSGVASASCNLTAGVDTAASSATSNLSTTNGLLDVIVNATHGSGGFNDSPSGTSTASFSQILVVTGGSGTGLLTADFTGFDDAMESSGTATNPILSITLGSMTTTYTPGLTNSPFSFSTAFTYGTPLLFQASLSASGTAPFLMMNAASSANIEGRVSFTGFALTNANAQPIPGTVVFAPEPAVAILSGLGLIALAMIGRNRQSK